MPRVVVVGSLNMDLVVAVEAHPRIGETVSGGNLRTIPGGKGANQAIAARRLGASVAIVGRIGADGFGETLLSLQRAEGIDVHHLIMVEDASTGVALITVAADASNTIVVTPGANAAWRDDALDPVAFARGDILLVQLETPLWLVETALRKAGEAGATRILNPSPLAAFDAKLLPLSNIVVLNEIELATIASMPIPADGSLDNVGAAAARVIAAGCPHVVVTLGERGALVCSETEATPVEGRVVEAIDTTGAGDCFTGALAAALLRGLALTDAARFANVAAAISVTREGASPSMPTLQDVEAL